MPIYSYRCEHCGHQKDVLQKMSDPLLVTCPACGEPTFRKQVTAAGFQLKGSGWYVTDFRNPASKEPAKGVPKAESESGSAKDSATSGGASGTAESPPAAKPATTDTKSESAPSPPAPKLASGGNGGTS